MPRVPRMAGGGGTHHRKITEDRFKLDSPQGNRKEGRGGDIGSDRVPSCPELRDSKDISFISHPKQAQKWLDFGGAPLNSGAIQSS